MNTTSLIRKHRPSHSITHVVALLATAAALVLVVASPASGATTHANVTPPTNIPDLSKLAVAITDFAPGARVRRQGYVRPDDFVASYEREFKAGTTRLGARRFMFFESDVELAKTPGDAQFYYSLFKLFSGAIDPDEVAADMRTD